MLQMAGAIAAEILTAIFANYFYMFLYVLVIMYIRSQYQKYSELQSAVYGKPERDLREITERIILTGLVAGFAASFAAIAAGITIELKTARYLFFIMCFLLIFNLRFACISYAVGILATVSLIFGIANVNVPSLLCLAAVLQIVESVLIFLNRKSDFIPVFIKSNDEIAGAFLIRRFWMIPVVFFTHILQSGMMAAGLAAGRPLLFGSSPVEAGAWALGLDCLVALLCHTDIAITMHPDKKSLQSAGMLFAYGTALLLIAVISVNNKWVGYIGIAFCILGHEMIYFYSRMSEKNGVPLYSAVKRGLRIMDVLPGSHAAKMGLERGDVILSINNHDIQSVEGVNEALREYPCYTWIHVHGWDGKERTVEYRCFPGGYNSLGIISVPREKEVTYKVEYFEHISILQNIVNRFRGMDKTI